MRWMLALLVLLAAQFVPGVAAAAECALVADHCDRGEAYALAKAEYDAFLAARPNYVFRYDGSTVTRVHHSASGSTSGSYKPLYWWSDNGSGQAGYDTNNTVRYYDQLCKVGTWNDVTMTCHDPQQCLAKEPLGASYVNSVTSSTCNDGCEYKAVTDTVSVEIAGTGAQTTVSGWEPTGNACPAGAPTPQSLGDPQACVPAGQDAAGRNYTVCIKPDGKHCYTGKVDKQICWRPGETGEKTDGELLQKRNVGGTPVPPTTTPPPGSSLAQGQSMTTTTHVGGNTFNTTTTNYTTNGAEVAPDMPSSGESADGTGGPSPGGDQGSVSGGVDCESPPVVTGDPILANIVLQTWGTRCAAESQNAVKATGNIEDCSSPFVVTGPADDPNTSKLKGIRADICGSYGDANGDGQPDWTEGEAPPIPGEGEPGPGEEPGPPSGLEVGTGLLDVEGFLGLGASAPLLGVLDLGFTTFDMDSLPFWADLVAIMRAIVLMVCAFGAVKILMGGSI